MGGQEISIPQRLRIIRWHHAVCPDGHDERRAAWKNRLAGQIGVASSTITNWCSDHKIKPRNEMLARLGQAEDEVFLGILGFDSEVRDLSEEQNDSVQIVASVSSEDDYAAVCLHAGIRLREEKYAVAKRRIDAEVEAVGDRQAAWRSRDKACWLQRVGGQVISDAQIGVPMHQAEQDAVREVSDALTNGDPSSPVAVLHAQPHSGVSYALQRLLPAQPGFFSCFDGGVYHLHLGALENISETQSVISKSILNAEVSEHVPSRHRTVAEMLAGHLSAQRQLLIIHGATAANTGLPAPTKRAAFRFIESLVEELAKISASQANLRICRLLLTCWDVDTFYYLNNAKVRRVEYTPTIGGDEAINYLERLQDYYGYVRYMAEGRERRGGAKEVMDGFSYSSPLSESVATHARPDSSLLKRIAHHYAEKSLPHTELPSAVRFRAFCASDVGAPCTFDPTQGVWERVGSTLRSGIPEIADCLTDIRSDIRTYGEHSPSDLMTLRLISTSLFFFSENMLEKLRSHPISRSFVSDTSFQPTIPQAKYVYRFEHEESGRVATMPLLVRSLIQDDWMRFQRGASRAAVHEAIGEILLEEATRRAPGALAKELPYAAPWGREEIALALEAIRHFMRAAASQDREGAERLTERSVVAYDNFLEPNIFVDRGPPSKKRQDPISKWTLSRAHGLHGLKYEALCLLSEDGRGQFCPRGFDAARSAIFFRELGITLTRMLRSTDALVAFQRAKDAASADNRAKAYLSAHEVTAHIMRGDMTRAAFALQEAKSIESAARLDSKSREQIRGRNEARAAAIAFAEGNIHTAIGIWRSLADSGLSPFSSDRAVGYIDAVIASDAEWERDRATVWRATELASAEAYNKGLEYERLRLAIRRAAIARRLGYSSVAEAMLDQVGIDLGRHGGGEVVFREFQFEGAIVLKELERPRYAFSAYAWPAFEGLRHRDATPWTRRAQDICSDLLAVMEAGLEETLPDFATHPFWLATESFDLGPEHPFYSLDLLPPQSVVSQTFEDLRNPKVRMRYSKELGRI